MTGAKIGNETTRGYDNSDDEGGDNNNERGTTIETTRQQGGHKKNDERGHGLWGTRTDCLGRSPPTGLGFTWYLHSLYILSSYTA